MSYTIAISAPVGKGAKNRPGDVKLLQQLLNRSRRTGQFLLRVDGICGPRTIAAITEFQRSYLRFKHADGVVQPLGPTMSGLSALASHRPSPRNPKQAAKLLPHPLQTTGLSVEHTIAWGAKVSQEFKRKIIVMCNYLNVSPDFLMAAMAFESGETFSASQKNKAGSGAVGLIQFMPKTAKYLGTSTELLAAMSAEEQLDYVKKYFEPNKGRLQTLEDVYMAILYPAAIGDGPDHVLFASGTKAYDQNKGLDANKDGNVTVGEAVSAVRRKLEKGLSPGYAG